VEELRIAMTLLMLLSMRINDLLTLIAQLPTRVTLHQSVSASTLEKVRYLLLLLFYYISCRYQPAMEPHPQ
jgi:hypothetical protein